jgi:hypothetical protein
MNTTLRSARARAIAGWTGVFAAACGTLWLAGCTNNADGGSGDGPVTYETGHALGDFVGAWTAAGWAQGAEGPRREIRGTAEGVRDKNYFVRLDVSYPDPASPTPVTGTCVFAQMGGRTVKLTTWFSSSPIMRQYIGTMSADGKRFTFEDGGRTLILKVNGSTSWEAEVWNDGRQIEGYTFTRTGG